MVEVSERELTVYGFAPLIWAVLATMESGLFSSLGVSKQIWVMNFFWASLVFLVVGISGLPRREPVVEKWLESLSVDLGLIGLLMVGVEGYRLSWW